MTVPEIKINGQFPEGLRITIEKWDILVDDNKQVAVVLDLIDEFNKQIEDKINKPYQEEIANMLREGKSPKLGVDKYPSIDKGIYQENNKGVAPIPMKITPHEHSIKVNKNNKNKFYRI
jgi:hypothetical protein